MMKKQGIWFLLFLFISCKINSEKTDTLNIGEVKIDWSENVTGDFSFKEKWNYPEGVYKNEFGQLSCDGFCPPETDAMKDANGKIFKDSLTAFYKLVDTTHYLHSFQSTANVAEWAGSNFATAKQISKDTVICSSMTNIATHTSLKLIITNNTCHPIIDTESIVANAKVETVLFESGTIQIDKKLWKKGILKAKFDFVFKNSKNPKEPAFWKGNILAKIEKQ